MVLIFILRNMNVNFGIRRSIHVNISVRIIHSRINTASKFYTNIGVSINIVNSISNSVTVSTSFNMMIVFTGMLVAVLFLHENLTDQNINVLMYLYFDIVVCIFMHISICRCAVVLVLVYIIISI